MKLCYECMRYAEEHNESCPYCKKDYTIKNLESTHLLPGTILIGRYIVGKSIGQGGFGITYVGLDIKFNRKVAIKELFPKGVVSRLGNKEVEEPTVNEDHVLYEKLKDKFTHEARTLARFDNEPGIVEVFDYFDDNNTTYIVMEFVEGNTLKEHLGKDKSLPVSDAIDMLLPIMKSLKAVHEAGLVHRDISPSNIILSKKGAVLIDFGAARFFAEDDATKTVMYKQGYAPLEQYDEYGDQGPWTDVYAMSGTLYRCITGKALKAATSRLDGYLEWPTEIEANINPQIKDTIERGLAIRVKDRIQSIDELIAGLTQIEEDVTISQEAETETVEEVEEKEDLTAVKKTEEKEDLTVVKETEEKEDLTAVKETEKKEDLTVVKKPEEKEDLTVVKKIEEKKDLTVVKKSEEKEDLTVVKKPEEKEDLTDVKKIEEKEDKNEKEEEDKPSIKPYLIIVGAIILAVLGGVLIHNLIQKNNVPDETTQPGEVTTAPSEDTLSDTDEEGVGAELSGEEALKETLKKYLNVTDEKIISQKIVDGVKNSNDIEGLFFVGEILNNGGADYYDGTLWYVRGTEVQEVVNGIFVDTGEYTVVKDTEFVYINYFDGKDEVEKTAFFYITNNEIKEASISGLGYYGGIHNDDIMIYITSNDCTYDMEEGKYVGYSQKPYDLIYSPEEDEFYQYSSQSLSRGEVIELCGEDLFYKMQNKGYNIINAFVRNDVVTINYYVVIDNAVRFNQVNWDVNMKGYLVISKNDQLDDLDRSGYEGFYLDSLNNIDDMPEYFKNVDEQLNAKFMFKNQPIIVGSKVLFGTFEQNCTDITAEDIVWRVLDINEGKALLFSEYVLDYEAYNTVDTKVWWENSTLRQYMNVPFYEYAFTDADRARIVPTQKDGIIDNVFALSHSEVHPTSKEQTYQFPMLSEATEYAISQKGAKVHDGVHCRWWSSTGNGESGQIGAWVFGAKESETTVLSSGITYASTDEFLYPSSLAGIRPAVWVKLD